MMYPYITLADETEITHSHIMDSDGVQIVEVHFERPVEKGFCSARCSLPSYKWKFNEGFSAAEIDFVNEFLPGRNGFFQRISAQQRPSALPLCGAGRDSLCLVCFVSVVIWFFSGPMKMANQSMFT